MKYVLESSFCVSLEIIRIACECKSSCVNLSAGNEA